MSFWIVTDIEVCVGYQTFFLYFVFYNFFHGFLKKWYSMICLAPNLKSVKLFLWGKATLYLVNVRRLYFDLQVN